MTHVNEPTRQSIPKSGRTGVLRGPVVVLAVIGGIAVLTVAAVIAPTLALREREPELEVYGQVPAFRLEDHTGAAITDQDLRGKVVIANFIFTRCATVCPVMTMKMRRVQERTEDVADELKLISFSVDPEHDTARVLADYAARNGADESRWRFVTGPLAAMKQVVTGGFAVAMDPMGVQPNGAPNVVHAEHFVLIDRAGQIRGYYGSNDANRVERLLRDARKLMAARP